MFVFVFYFYRGTGVWGCLFTVLLLLPQLLNVIQVINFSYFLLKKIAFSQKVLLQKGHRTVVKIVYEMVMNFTKYNAY